MFIRPIRHTALLLTLLAAAPLAAQNESPLRDRGVSTDNSAQRLMDADAAADAAVANKEAPRDEETPVVAEALPTGRIDVGTLQTATPPLEESEAPDPEGDAADAETQQD